MPDEIEVGRMERGNGGTIAMKHDYDSTLCLEIMLMFMPG